MQGDIGRLHFADIGSVIATKWAAFLQQRQLRFLVFKEIASSTAMAKRNPDAISSLAKSTNGAFHRFGYFRDRKLLPGVSLQLRSVAEALFKSMRSRAFSGGPLGQAWYARE